MDKVKVNGKDAHEVFHYIRTNYDGFKNTDGTYSMIGWNFGKFIIGKKGDIIT